MPEPIESPPPRPPSVPALGLIEAFDAGWYAREVGLERETALVLSNRSVRAWALLGWDALDLLDRRRSERAA